MAEFIYQYGSVAKATSSPPDFEGGTVLIQARTILPFTSISQAPQLPPKHPVGIETSAWLAAFNQSSPMVSMVVCPFGQITSMCGVDIAEIQSCTPCCLSVWLRKNPLLLEGAVIFSEESDQS